MRAKNHYWSLLAFFVFILGAVLFFSTGLILIVSVLMEFFGHEYVQAGSLVYFTTMSFTGILLVVAAVISFMRFINKPSVELDVNNSFAWWQLIMGVIGAGLSIYIGNFIQEKDLINWLFMPILAIPAVVLPIWLTFKVASRNLLIGSRWRTWSVFGFGLVVTPTIVFILEVIIIVFILIFVLVIVFTNPELTATWEALGSQFARLDPESEEALQQLIPYLFKPGTIITILSFFSLLVPLLEELFKPLAVWILSTRLNSRAQGFALGALSGTAFALLETFNVSGQLDDWGELLFMRIGTGLLHITCSAMMGAAIYVVVREKRYLNFLGTYMFAVLLHGTWNAAAITYGVTDLPGNISLPVDVNNLALYSIVVLSLLSLVFIGLLIGFNRALQSKAQTSLDMTIPSE